MSVRSELCESPEEERANAISHGVGALLSLVGLVLMVVAALPLSTWHLVGASVFGLSLLLLYSASTIYHSVSSPRMKQIFQVVDHALIFVLIAGSYTPWLLVNLRGPWGWSLLAAVWGMALVGIVIKAIFLPRFDRLGTILYLAIGWLGVVAIKPFLANVNTLGGVWLAAGGLFYSVGVIFYLQQNRRFSHLAWHLFVLAGSFCHVVAVMEGVLV